MKKIIILILASYTCFGQEDKSIADEIRKNFNYDSLSSLSCLNTPPGIYIIKFKIDKRGKFYDFETFNDTLKELNKFFVEAIKECDNPSALKKMKKGSYLQLIYFNNILDCNLFRNKDNSIMEFAPDTTIDFSVNYDRDIIKVLSDQISSIEKSIIDLQISDFKGERLMCLPIALINNENPNLDKSGPGFKNDMKEKKATKAELEMIEKLIQERKQYKRIN